MHLWILALIFTVIVCRITMLSDSLTYFFYPEQEYYHFIPLFLNYFMYAMSFMGLTEIPLCFGLLWYAFPTSLTPRLDVVFCIQDQTNDLEEQVHGSRTYKAIKVFLVLAPMAVVAAFINIYLKNFSVIFWIAGLLSISTMILVAISGRIFNLALEGIYKGQYLRHVIPRVGTH